MRRQRKDEPYAGKHKIANKKVNSSLIFSDRKQQYSLQIR